MRIRLSILLLVLFVIPLVWLAFLAFQVYSFSLVQANLSADAAVVLGAGISGNQPSPVFQERINHAIDLYQSKKVPYIIFTGGRGKGQLFTESEIAKAYAIQRSPVG
jgi:vancomycin permeability regulator SanA